MCIVFVEGKRDNLPSQKTSYWLCQPSISEFHNIILRLSLVNFYKASKPFVSFKEFSGYLDGAIDDCHYFRMESAEECFFITRHHFLDFIDPLPNEYFTELREFMYNFPDDHVYNTYEFLKACLQCMFCGSKCYNFGLDVMGKLSSLL